MAEAGNMESDLQKNQNDFLEGMGCLKLEDNGTDDDKTADLDLEGAAGGTSGTEQNIIFETNIEEVNGILNSQSTLNAITDLGLAVNQLNGPVTINNYFIFQNGSCTKEEIAAISKLITEQTASKTKTDSKTTEIDRKAKEKDAELKVSARREIFERQEFFKNNPKPKSSENTMAKLRNSF